MTDSVYKVVEAEVVTLDMHLDNGKVIAYRAKVKVSFTYHDKE